MYVKFNKPSEAIPKYFRHFFYDERVGLVTAIVGSTFLKTGTGKSYSALKIGELLDKDFSLDKVVYDPRDFLKVMDRVEESGKISQVVVVDEGEITAPAQLWYSFTNKAIAYTLATFRYLRSMAIFVSPALSWLDKKVRMLVSHVGFSEKYFPPGSSRKASVRLRLYRIKTDLFGDKIFFEKIRMFDGVNKRVVKFRHFKVGLPSEDLAEAYEKKSREFKSTMRKGLVKEMDKFAKYEDGKDEEKKNLKSLVDIAIKNKLINYELQKKNKVSATVVRYAMSDHNLTFSEARMLSKMINIMWGGKHNME